MRCRTSGGYSLSIAGIAEKAVVSWAKKRQSDIVRNDDLYFSLFVLILVRL